MPPKDVPIVPAARPLGSAVPPPKLERPDMVEPGHGLVILLGGETPISGLMPPLVISVAPSGIVPPLRVRLLLDPGVENGDALPVDVTVDDVQPESAAPNVDPPPSNVELVPVDMELMPVVDVEPVPVMIDVDPLPPDVSGNPFDGHGLRPPGLISVAPSGIPVVLGGLAPVARVAVDAVELPEPGMPSGEVAPIPDVVVVLCASAMSPLNTIASRRGQRRRIETPIFRCAVSLSQWFDQYASSRPSPPPRAGRHRLQRCGHQGYAGAPGRAGSKPDAAGSDLLRRLSRRAWRDRNVLRADPANTALGQSEAGRNQLRPGGLCHGNCRDAQEQASGSGNHQRELAMCHETSPVLSISM